MTRILIPRAVAALLAVVAVVAPDATPAHAQAAGREGSAGRTDGAAAWSYEVRDSEERFGSPGWDEPLPDVDVYGDWQPLRVVQSASFTWITTPGGSTRDARSARLVLQGNEPVLPGPGGLLVRGWPDRTAASDEPVRLELTRGTRDRTVAGRNALHYRLTALVDQVDTVRTVARGREQSGQWGWSQEPARAPEPVVQRYQVTADLWILPGLPFSWASFGADDDALPFLLPGVRAALQPELGSLGLVGRAVLRYEVTPIRDGMPAGGSRRLRAFEIADLQRHDAPTPPDEPVIERSLLDALDRLALLRPRRVCDAAADGDLPAIVRARVDLAQHGPLLGYLTDRCRRQE